MTTAAPRSPTQRSTERGARRDAVPARHREQEIADVQPGRLADRAERGAVARCRGDHALVESRLGAAPDDEQHVARQILEPDGFAPRGAMPEWDHGHERLAAVDPLSLEPRAVARVVEQPKIEVAVAQPPHLLLAGQVHHAGLALDAALANQAEERLQTLQRHIGSATHPELHAPDYRATSSDLPSVKFRICALMRAPVVRATAVSPVTSPSAARGVQTRPCPSRSSDR